MEHLVLKATHRHHDLCTGFDGSSRAGACFILYLLSFETHLRKVIIFNKNSREQCVSLSELLISSCAHPYKLKFDI